MPYTMTYTGYEYDEPETIKGEDEKVDDVTESIRRVMVKELNAKKAEREALEQKYGKVWDTEELTRDFEMTGFMAPYVVVTRKSDRQQGTLTFQHSPRYYFNFEPIE
jgi:hypothetical protein